MKDNIFQKKIKLKNYFYANDHDNAKKSQEVEQHCCNNKNIDNKIVLFWDVSVPV